MTRMQRRAEDQLAKEVETRNNQLTTEDREKNLRWMVVGRRGKKRMIKGTEREQQNYTRREIQLGDYFPNGGPGVQRDHRNELQTGARRKEYLQQQATSILDPQLLSPRQSNSANYVPVQHSQRQQYHNSTNWQQRGEPQYRPTQQVYSHNNAQRAYNNNVGQVNGGGGSGYSQTWRDNNTN
jgi:hypothetical protein